MGRRPSKRVLKPVRKILRDLEETLDLQGFATIAAVCVLNNEADVGRKSERN